MGYMLIQNATGVTTQFDFGVVEQFRFPRFNEVAEAVKAFEGRRSALEMLDAFRYPKVKL